MIINQLHELYNGLIPAVVMCYIIFRLNKDLKRASALNYLFSALTITLGVHLVGLMFPELNMFIRLMTNVLIVVFVILIFHKYSIYYSVLTALMGGIFLGFADILVVLTYLFPLKLDIQSFKTSYIHNTVGGILMFLFIYLLLKLIAGNFIKARKRIYKKYNKLTILLSTNLIAVFFMMVFVSSIFGYYLEYRVQGDRYIFSYFTTALITVVLATFIVSTLYLINYLILNRLKYDRLKMKYGLDAMTDTLNRVSGINFIGEQLEICKSLNKNLTVCFVDINDLKVVNDMLGHRKGDELIKAIVRTMKENIRETDVISRLGGDEFVVVFPGYNIECGKKVMERISEKLRNLELFKSDQYTISISYGCSEYGGDVEITVDSLLDKADQEMYVYKRTVKAVS